MKLKVKRNPSTKTTTTGELLVDGEHFAWTVEDVVRDLGPHGEGKVMFETAIPAGTYNVIINFSQRFKKNMMRLENVPFFTGILIHGGNTAEDTHGCILVGYELAGERIKPGTSTPAIHDLFEKVSKAIAAGDKVEIEVG